MTKIHTIVAQSTPEFCHMRTDDERRYCQIRFRVDFYYLRLKYLSDSYHVICYLLYN